MQITHAILIALIAMTSFCSCAIPQPPPPVQGYPAIECSYRDDFYHNPTYELPRLKDLKHHLEPQRTYPPDPPSATRSYEQLIEFCLGIQERFRCSNVTDYEAERFLDLLSQHLSLSTGTLGMPSPDDPPPGPVNLRDRVMVRRVADRTWEIFHWSTGCGVHYAYSRVVVDGPDLKIDHIELWHEPHPC